MDESPTGTFIIMSVDDLVDDQEPETTGIVTLDCTNGFKINSIRPGQQTTPRIRFRAPFSVEGQTIPTKCPRCHTENQITQKIENHWQCRACDFEWRS